jgi:hypothetical protein
MTGRPKGDRGPLAELRARRLAIEPVCRRCWRPSAEARVARPWHAPDDLSLEQTVALCHACADERAP